MKPTKARKSRPILPTADRLSSRQLKLIILAAVSFAVIAAVGAVWNNIFPVREEDLVEVAWTHECRCVDGWMNSLRADGFVVRDYELENLRARRQIWHVPNAVHGCHPAVYLGYVLDGHVPPALIRRLGREHPSAIALIQVSPKAESGDAAPTSTEHFELLNRDGTRVPWPPSSYPDPSQHL
jgi:hypothetical protein